MTPIERLELVKSRLQTLQPDALVTRDHKALEQDDNMAINKRIYAIVSMGFPRFGRLPFAASDAEHEFVIIAQQQHLDKVTGDEIENTEFAMLEVIEQLVNEDYESQECLNLELRSFKSSMQNEHPFSVMGCYLAFNDL